MTYSLSMVFTLTSSLNRVSSSSVGISPILSCDQEATEECQQPKEPPLDRIGDVWSVAYRGEVGGDIWNEITTDKVEVEAFARYRSLFVPFLQL